MNYHDFEYICSQELTLRFQKKKLPGKIEVRPVFKMNTVYHGMTFLQKEDDMSPVANLDSFYEEEENGKSLARIFDEIEELILSPLPPVDIDLFENQEELKKRLFIRLTPSNCSGVFSLKAPTRNFLDLLVSCHVLLENGKHAVVSAPLTYEILELAGMKEKDAFRYAFRNTPLLFAEKFMKLSTYMEAKLEEEIPDTPLYILTNQEENYGASLICIGRRMEEISHYLEDSFYIIPSSIHEVLIVPQRDAEKTEDMNDMVKEVNRAHVSEQDFLSDHVYFYDQKSKKVKMA